jgi:hypothetical protein
MPPVIPQHLEVAKKRMKMGLHPAVLAAIQRSLTGVREASDPSRHGTLAQQTAGAFNRREIPLSLGRGVNQRSGPTAFGHPVMGSRQGQSYDASIQRTAGGGWQEVHDYGNGRRVAFARKPTQAVMQRIVAANPTLNQHLSNTATAEDKMIALAHRAAVAKQNALQDRKFARKPGLMQRY